MICDVSHIFNLCLIYVRNGNNFTDTLEFRGTDFTDNVAKDFAAALKHSNCKLKSLNLSYNNFTDRQRSEGFGWSP